MSARYTALSNPRSAPDAERELEDAFDLDDDNDESAHESTPLTNNVVSAHPDSANHNKTETSAFSGAAYDFEREYDFPPPGSPPPPSSRALPNDFGNSNGLLPTAPVAIPKPRRSLFQRAFGAIIPTHYQRVPTENHSTRLTGGGTENDGVFANVTAKPQAARVIHGEDGEIHVVPEDSQKETPPSYLEAQADAVPPYWETTIHAPAGLDGSDLIIDDLPTGSFLIFCLNVFVSFFFQFVGFLLTYLLHTSHAAKFGSRAGLGLTLIQYGFYSRTVNFSDDPTTDGEGGAASSEDSWGSPPAPVPSDGVSSPAGSDLSDMSTTSRDWLSFLFMTLGWFLLLSSIIGYWRVKRWETSVRTPAPPRTPEQIALDRTVRQNLEQVFGFSFGDEHETGVHRDAAGNVIQGQVDDARLARDLRAAGIL